MQTNLTNNCFIQLFDYRNERRLFIYSAEIVDIIYLKQLLLLSQDQAVADGFKNSKEAIELLLEANKGYKAENGAFITVFKAKKIPFKKMRKSIVFTHLLDELLKQTKQQTIRMRIIPKYVVGEIINIVWKYKDHQKAVYDFNNIQDVYKYVYDFVKNNRMGVFE